MSSCILRFTRAKARVEGVGSFFVFLAAHGRPVSVGFGSFIFFSSRFGARRNNVSASQFRGHGFVRVSA